LIPYSSFEASKVQDFGLHRCPTITLSIKNKKTQVYLSNLIEQLILFRVFMSQKNSQHQLVPGAVLILM